MIDVVGWRSWKNHPPLGGMKEDRPMAADKEALLAEERKLRRLSRAMDLAAALLWRVDLTLEEAQDVVNHAKHTALELFPDKEETFDLIYGSRFRRILVEKYRLQ
jgi:hypothetical protein